MTLQQLEYIVAVDKHRHFTRAAEECGVTQSTLSTLIQKLENELDVSIFERGAHGVKPTPLGSKIIAKAKVVLLSAANLRDLVADFKGETAVDVKMGIVSTVAPYVLPKMLKALRISHPEVRLTVEESRIADIAWKLEHGELDMALVPVPLGNESLFEIPVYEERLLPYISPSEQYFNKDHLVPEDLPLEHVWTLREGYCPTGGRFRFCNYTHERMARYEAGNIETLVKIVDENGGFAIIPELHADLLCEEQRQNVRHFSESAPRRTVALVIHNGYIRERLLNVIADAIKEVVPKEMLVERIKKFPIKL